MAVIARLSVDAAGPDDHDRLQHVIDANLAARGGPPEGLMAHLGYPSGDGFLVVEAWRTEEDFRSFMTDVLLPAFDAVGLRATAPEVGPAWSIALP